MTMKNKVVMVSKFLELFLTMLTFLLTLILIKKPESYEPKKAKILSVKLEVYMMSC